MPGPDHFAKNAGLHERDLVSLAAVMAEAFLAAHAGGRALIEEDGQRADGWAAPVYDREGRIGGGWKRDGTFHARGFGVGATSAPARDVPRTPLAQGNADRVALSVDDAGMLRGKGFATPAPVAPARDVPHLPVVHDLFGRASIALEPSGAVVLPKISERTAQMIRALVGVSESIPGGLLAGVPGWNHRIYDAEHCLVTMPTKMGPVDALYPVAGAGLQFAATRRPVELLSVSGQSNTFLGGDMDAGINGFALRGVRDPHWAFRSAHGNSWGDGVNSAAPYTPGDLGAIVPAGQDDEPTNAGQFTPDAIQFSILSTDLREARDQGVYLQLTSAESGTPLTQYLAGTTKGDNIASYIPAAEALMQGTYGRDLIMYAHFLIGHEGTDFTGYSSYAELLSAFADQVWPRR